MLISDSMKAINLPQSLQSETTALCGGSTTNNATGNANATPAPAATGTPLRSRNQNRGDKQTDDKSENASAARGKNPPKPPDEFYRDLQQFHEKRSTPIRNIPRITGHEVDLHRLYCEVIERGGFQKVNMRDEWEEVLPELGWKDKIVNGSAGLKYIYRRFLEKYERINYFGEDPEKVDASESADIAEIMGTATSGRSGRGTSRYPSSLFGNAAAANAAIHNVAMTFNYKQHHINLEKRRQFKLSTDLHKPSPYEKLMLSLLSPLPNEQDFAINACTLMANESKHTMKLSEYPKLLDALLAHTGVFSDYPMRKLFQHIYSGVRHHSLYGFWYDLLHEQPQILDLYSDEQAVREAGLIDDWDDGKNYIEEGIWCDSKELDFLNLGRGLGTQDHVGQRVLQVVAILRNLSFFEENLPILVKNKTFLRFLVMSSNIRWSNVHIQALEIAGNIVGELDLLDPSTDDLSRCLMSTICDGIEGSDRGVIINCLEILYKLCQRDTNEDYVLKSLAPTFYNTMALFLSLNDIMLLLFTLEAIYALTCLGSKSCHSMMQVRGIIDQLVSLISVEAQSYGPDGCILMRVVETVPGNMLPMVAQNIANLQNASVIQKPNPILHVTTPSLMKAQILPNSPMLAVDMAESIPVPPAPPSVTAAPPLEHTHSTPQIQMPINFTHEDEQYALAWLGATFERTVNTECHVEQQELYRMYLSHCQKSGKHSVVNHVHFPRLVRLIFTNSVGPAIVRKVDGTDLAGLHYVSIRLRAQPLPLQQKTSAGAALPSIKQADTVSPARKAKKKPKPTENNCSNALNESIVPSTAIVENVKLDQENASPTLSTATDVKNSSEQSRLPPHTGEIKTVDKMDVDEPEVETKTEEAESESSTVAAETSACQPHSSQSSMIKSLLANKVNQRQQKQKDVATTITQTTTTSQTSAAPNIASQQPIKVASTAITALVNNPLMQNTPVKVGQTTIKPLNPQLALEKKQHITESTPPPLAPLSGANVAKDATGRPILIANHVLADILDKKVADSPMTSNNIVQKRKMDDTHVHNKRLAVDSSNVSSAKETPVTPSKNAANLYAEMAASILEDEDLEEFSSQSSSSTNPQTIIEQPLQQHQSSLIVPSKVQQTGGGIPGLQNVPRQLMFQSNQPPQLKMTQTSAGTTTQQIPNAVATIKTDQGLQTVPVILHQKPMDSTSQTQIIQQVMQPSNSPQTQTQYVLATNQQGQTYLVAQQTQPQPPPPPQQPTQTVLVTQTPQQQSTGAKTIIILQQQPLQGSQQPQQIISTSTQGQPQKMIMTTAQGQQVLVTQRPQTPQQIFINPQTGAATHIQHVPVTQSRQIIQTTSATVSSQQQAPTQLQAGQISPSLLNQLNQIPATIKLHQPIAQTPSGSRINMPKGGSVSIVQGPPPPQSTPTAPVAIPQLQQHQSIIQQHIISGPSEKRHVILGGGRAIEIKETLITQAQPPPQQCQLNSQTIITTQQQPSGSTPPLLQQQTQQQVQQQIRAVLEQQQHPSIIQQKISTFSAISQQSQQHHSLSQASQQSHVVQVTMPAGPNITQTPALLAAKVSDSTPTSLIPGKTMPSLPSVILPGGAANQAAIKKSLLPGPPSLIKPSLPTVKLPTSNISGPPPLAAVNSAITSTSSTAGQPHHNLPSNLADKDSNRKEEVVKTPNPIQSSATTNTTSTAISTQAMGATSSVASAIPIAPSAPLPTIPQVPQQPPPSYPQQVMPSQPQLSAADAQWLYICDWRNCPRKKFKSMSDLQHHVCTAHAPDHLDQYAEIFCQWGVGPGLCDGIPRRRYSLMTHLLDRHISVDVLRAAAQRRIATGMHNIAPTKPPVTIVRNNVEMTPHINPGSTAFQTMKRHTADFINCKELMDENEGPVTKSIRLTAALILRNMVTYTATAKRAIRRHEAHLANIALSNVESSGTISHILYELNN